MPKTPPSTRLAVFVCYLPTLDQSPNHLLAPGTPPLSLELLLVLLPVPPSSLRRPPRESRFCLLLVPRRALVRRRSFAAVGNLHISLNYGFSRRTSATAIIKPPSTRRHLHGCTPFDFFVESPATAPVTCHGTSRHVTACRGKAHGSRYATGCATTMPAEIV